MKNSRWILAAFLSSYPEEWAVNRCSKLYLSPLPILTPSPTIHEIKGDERITGAQPLSLVSLATTSSPLTGSIRDWLLVPPASAAEPPTQADIQLLNRALETFYSNTEYPKALDLLSQTVDRWIEQPPDERASLHRIRADCYMALQQPNKAMDDYSQAINLLQTPEAKDAADPNELPAALLGRARAQRSLSSTNAGQPVDWNQAASDYKQSFQLSSREEWDTVEELIEDGAQRNPFAAWEWGTSLRAAGRYDEAAQAHQLASQSFAQIGDTARSVISQLDAGIDIASSSKSIEQTKEVLTEAISKTTSVEGRDVSLLQRVVAKEGEARMALASVLWSSAKDRPAAEDQLGQACLRLDQLEADSQTRKNDERSQALPTSLQFSIDDQPAVLDCGSFKSDKFLSETLKWPTSLKEKMQRLNTLSVAK